MRIPPLSDAIVTLKLTDEDGVAVNTATVTGAVYAPNARLIAPISPATLPIPAVGSGGLYELAWDKTWTTHNGKTVLGEYIVVVTGINAGITRTEHFRLPVAWGDTT